MTEDFNLTARVVLQEPSSSDIKAFTAKVRQALENVPINIKLNFDQNALTQINNLNRSLSSVQSNADNVVNSLALVSNEMGKLNSANARVNRSMADTERTLNRNNETLLNTTEIVANLGRTAGIAARRFIGYTVAAGTILSLAAAFRAGVTEALKFQREMVRLEQVGVESQKSLADISSEITRLSTSVGVSSAELASAAVIIKQAGFTAKDTATLLGTLAATAVAPNFKDITDTTETMIAVMRQFNITADDTREVFGAINAVAGAFAVEAKDIGDVIKRAGGSFNAIGGDYKQLLALFTSVRETTRESSESIATGLRTIFTRIQRPELIEDLRELGINLRYSREEAIALGNVDLERQFVGGYEAIRRIGEALRGIQTTDPRYAIIAEQLGGYRQISKVLPLLQQQETQQKALNVAQIGAISLTDAQDKAQKAHLITLTKIKEEFLAIFRAIENSTAFRGLLTFVEGTLKLMNQLLSVTKELLPLFLGIGAVKLLSFGKSFVSGQSGLATSFKEGFLHGGISPYVQRKNSGGFISGSGNSDSVQALLTPGEYVINKEAAKRFGYSRLDKVNAMRFANGGRVERDEFGKITSSNRKPVRGPRGRFIGNYGEGDVSLNYLPGSQSRITSSGGGQPHIFQPRSVELETPTVNAEVKSLILPSSSGNAAILNKTQQSQPSQYNQPFIFANNKITKELAEQMLKLSSFNTEIIKSSNFKNNTPIDYFKFGNPYFPKAEDAYTRGETYGVQGNVKEKRVYRKNPIGPVFLGAEAPYSPGFVIGNPNPKIPTNDTSGFNSQTQQIQAAPFSGGYVRTRDLMYNLAPLTPQQDVFGDSHLALNKGQNKSINLFEKLGPGVRRTPLEDPELTIRERYIGEGKFNPVKDSPSKASRIRARLSNADPLAIGIASSAAVYAGSLLERTSPDINANLTGEQRAGAYGIRGVSSGIQGAGIGAALGGLVGFTGIGAVVGGLVLLGSSLYDTHKQIKEAKIADEMAKFTDNLKKINSGIIGVESNRDSLLSTVRSRREEAAPSPGIIGSIFGVDYKAQQLQLSKNLSSAFINELPEIISFLSTDATKIGKNSSVRLSELQGPALDKAISELRNTFVKGNSGLNQEFLRLIADAKNVRLSDILQEFDKNIKQGISSASLAKRQADILENGLRQTASIGRIASVTQNISSIANRQSIIAGISDFQVGDAKEDINNPQSAQFLSTVKQVVSTFGDSAQDINRTAESYNQVFTNLSPILQDLSRAGGLNNQELGQRVRQELEGRLGEGRSSELNTILREVSNNINKLIEEDSAKFSKGVTTDVDQLIKELIIPSFQNFSRVINGAADNINAQFNRFYVGLNQLSQRQQAVIQQRAGLNQSTLESQRFGADISARAAGRPGAGIDFISLEQLQAPFNRLQEDLVRGGGLGNGDAFNVEAISQQLGELDKLRPIFTQQARESIQPEVREKAIQSLVDLESKSTSLVKALENLANTSNRLAGLNEKLAASRQKSENLTGFFGNVFQQSPRERGQLVSGLVTQERVRARGGSLEGLHQSQINNLFNTLRQIGDTFVPKFGRTGNEELREILRANVQRLPFAGPALKKLDQEQGGLENQIANAFKNDRDARQALIKLEENNQNKFFTNLQNILENSFINTQQADKNREISGIKANESQLDTNVGDLIRQLEASETLKGFGINQNQVNALVKTNRLENLQNVVGNTTNRIQEVFTKRPDIINDIFNKQLDFSKLPSNGQANFRKFISDDDVIKLSGVDDFLQNPLNLEERDKLLSRLSDRGVAREVEGGGFREVTGVDENAFKEQMKNVVLQTLQERVQGIETERTKALDEFKTQTSINSIGSIEQIKQVAEALANFKTNPENFTKAADEISNLQTQISGFTERIAELRQEIQKLETQKKPIVNTQGRPIVGVGGFGAAGFANGGSIFQPKGTDTVPAMLTPGEFVINRKSAEANSGLLDLINSSRGPVYLAEGGDLLEEMRANLARYPAPGRRQQIRDFRRSSGLQYIANRRHRLLYQKYLQDGDAESYFVGLRGVPKTTVADLAQSPDPFLQKRFARFNQQVPGFTDSLLERNQPLSLLQVQANERDKPLSVFREAERRIESRKQLEAAFGPLGQVGNERQSGVLRQYSVGQSASFFDNRSRSRELPRGRRGFANGGTVGYYADGGFAGFMERKRNAPPNQGGEFADFMTRKAARGPEGTLNIPRASGRGRVFSGPPPATFKPVRQRPMPRPQIKPNRLGRNISDMGAEIPSTPSNSFNAIGRRFTADQANIINRIKKRPRLDPTYVNAKSASAYARGGFVANTKYMEDGGDVSGGFGMDFTALTSFGAQFQSSASSFSSAVNFFSQSSGRLSDAISKFPSSISGSFSHTINVNFNGADMLAQLLPQIQSIAMSQAQEVLNRYVSQAMPDAGRDFS